MKKKSIIFIAADKPIPNTGGGQRCYYIAEMVARKWETHFFSLFPFAQNELPTPLNNHLSSLHITHQTFERSQKSVILFFLQLILFPFLFTKAIIILQADYLIRNPYNGKNQRKKYFWLMITWLLHQYALIIYKLGYQLPARTLERYHQFHSLKDTMEQTLQNGTDYIWQDFSYLYPYIQELINKYSIPIICNTHNVEWLYLERLAEKAHDKTAQKWLYKQASLMKNVEIACFKKAAIVFACSAVDAALIKEMAPAVNVIVLPNGVDDSLLIVDDAIKRQPNTLLFTGNFNYEPNINGITLFLEHIFPIIQAKIPDTTVVIAGRNAGKQLKAWKNQKGIQIIDSPESMLPYYNAAAVFIAPLWEGSGTRLKIVEAMQMECALISTEYAAEGLPINNNKQALIANDYQNFAEAVILCLHNPELRQKLIKEAKKTVKESFTWKVIESQLYNSLQQIN